MVEFSVQSPETDTVAVDLKGDIRRDSSGQIGFRPGGHGGLLENLARSGGDIVLVKNIDNIARQEFLDKIALIRQQISGVLLLVEKQVHEAIRSVRDGRDSLPALQLLEQYFGVRPESSIDDDNLRRRYVIAQLNRPIRVCGMVGSLDHSGGRPFWVDTDERGPSLQIIESAEVDMTEPSARRLFHKSRHFNPVDLACSIRDVDGVPFNLELFTNSTRAIIAKKTIAGVPSLVYEHPGLWNGAMALWNTAFVEIPDFVFNPVKSLSDLWATGHRM
jgi:hypothetical protein